MQRRYSVQCDLEVLADDESQAEMVVQEILFKAGVKHNIGETTEIEEEKKAFPLWGGDGPGHPCG